MSRFRPPPGDSAIYAGSAIVATAVALTASIPIFRAWGRVAVVPYAVCAVGALILLRSHRPALIVRLWIASVVLAGVVVVPLALEVTWRARTAPGLHVQSEAIIVEEGAVALTRGGDPYEARFTRGPLAARPPATKTHFPYLPAMLVFGLPRAVFGDHTWTDARVSFLVATLVVLAGALRRRAGAGSARLGVLQWLLLVPTGAVLAVTGGDDLPVVALLLLSAELARERRPVAAGIAAGLSLAMKQTALVAVPFLLLAAAGSPARGGRRATALMAIPAALVATAFVVPFVVWGPAAFLEDAVKFPLGFGDTPSPNAAPSLGRALTAVLSSARGPVTAALVLVALAFWAWLLLRRPAPNVAAAARRAAMAFAVILLLVPASRLGYWIYPVSLLAWGWHLREERLTQEAP